jgi:hypothetical protein
MKKTNKSKKKILVIAALSAILLITFYYFRKFDVSFFKVENEIIFETKTEKIQNYSFEIPRSSSAYQSENSIRISIPYPEEIAGEIKNSDYDHSFFIEIYPENITRIGDKTHQLKLRTNKTRGFYKLYSVKNIEFALLISSFKFLNKEKEINTIEMSLSPLISEEKTEYSKAVFDKIIESLKITN